MARAVPKGFSQDNVCLNCEQVSNKANVEEDFCDDCTERGLRRMSDDLAARQIAGTSIMMLFHGKRFVGLMRTMTTMTAPRRWDRGVKFMVSVSPWLIRRGLRQLREEQAR